MTSPTPQQVFRLISDELLFILDEGTLEVGSGESAAIRVPDRRVSRRHAQIEVRQGEVTVCDLGSRNGTEVEGRPVAGRIRLEVGQTICFGPCALTLELVPRSDVDLAIEFDVRRADSPAPSKLGRTTRTVGHPGDPLARIGSWCDRLLAPESGQPTELIEELAQLTGAIAAMALEAASGEEPVVLAQWGDPSALPDVERGAAAAMPSDRVVECWSGIPGESLGIMLAGVSVDRIADAEAWTGILARLLALGRGRGVALPAPGETPRLVFPAGYVPGTSPAAKTLRAEMERLAGHDISVLIQGETGVGKERVARILHDSSPRAGGPFVAINCAAVAESLLEAEMFGVARGAATGVVARPGAFTAADGGTLFLDEIGEMALELQATLLRALQDGDIRPVGGSPVRVDVRVIAATNKDLREQVAAGALRSDLYYRVAAATLSVPPLRERREDLPALVEAIVGRVSREAGHPIRGVTVRALDRLRRHGWPGNVRELENVLRNLAFSCRRGGAIDGASVEQALQVSARLPTGWTTRIGTLEERIAAVEEEAIREALATCGGSQRRAARRLGIARNTLAERIRRYGIAIGDGA